MRPGRLRRRPAAPTAAPPPPLATAATLASEGGPVARNARERGILTASAAIEAGRVIAGQSTSVQAAVRAALGARLRKRGTTIGAAYVAHVEAIAGRPHDEAEANAWRSAIVAVANLVQPP